MRDILKKKVVVVPLARSMLKTSESEPGTRTLCLFSFGAEIYSVLEGAALLGLNVMRLTACSAYMAPAFFSLCIGWFACTDIVVYTANFFVQLKK